MDSLKDHKFSFMTKEVVLVFKEDPTLESINTIRDFLDTLTDQLVMERLGGR